MTVPNRDRNLNHQAQDRAGVAYHCVCGETVLVSWDFGGTCESCHRRFAPEILRDVAQETITMPLSSSGLDHGTQSNHLHADDELIGQTFDHFRIIAKLGHGGMGTVYRALDESLQRFVALKIIRGHASSNADSKHVQRLQREAIAQARVNHPNVVHIYYVGRREGAPFFAMELVDGETLSDRLDAGKLAFPQIIDYAIRICDALDHAARYDIVHGDIKPSNVLLSTGDTLKLSDFGLARRLSEAAEDSSRGVGTPNYVAPEIIAGQAADIRSDMYSLGITLFQLTFGRLPYSPSGGIIEALEAHQKAPVEFPESWPSDVPEGWREVLSRLLSKAPKDRYRTYEDLIANLKMLQPISLPKAGRVQRGLAWLVDVGLTNTVVQLIFAPMLDEATRSFYADRPIARLASVIAAALVILCAGYVQSIWGTSPGKKLFQIRIVDRHGLRPRRTTLMLRAMVQLLPVWIVVARFLFSDVVLVGSIAILAVLADTIVAMIHRKGKSIHDFILGTQVVLDAGDSSRDRNSFYSRTSKQTIS